MLIAGAVTALVVEVGILKAIGYVVLRVATKFLQMRRDIEDLKIAVRELSQRA